MEFIDNSHELTDIVQVVQCIKSNIDSCFSELAKLNSTIAEIQHKQRTLVHIAEKNNLALKSIIKSKKIQDSCTDEFITECNNLIEYTENFTNKFYTII